MADLDGMIDLIRPHLQAARELPGRLVGVGVSLCGTVDPASGMALLVPNLHWRDVPFRSVMQAGLGLPVAVELDARLAALGEATWGAARGVENFAWVTMGTGLGAALWLNNRLYPGEHGFAGYFGHNVIDEVNGFPCGCGKRGCLETFVAGPAIARQGQAARDAGLSPLLNRLAGDRPVTAEMVFQADAAGEPAARQIIAAVVRLTALGLSHLVNILDVRLVVMGGGVAKAGPHFLERLAAQTRTYILSAQTAQDFHIAPESFPNASLFGAAAYAFQEI